LYETEEESAEPNQPTRSKLSLSKLNDNVREVHHVNTKDDWHESTQLETAFHVLFTYVLLLLQRVTLFQLVPNPAHVTQHWHNLVSTRPSLHISHNVVSQVSTEGVEHWVFREKHHLTDLVLVADFNVDQKAFQVIKKFGVFRALQFELHVVIVNGDIISLAVSAELLVDFKENLNDVKNWSHIIIEYDIYFLLNVVFQVFFSLNSHFFEFVFEYLCQEVNL
jgi:hypothetical protein